ncbi:MAG TPA: polysaccharide deacetylase family protein [Flavitalea sp.]|nr:polysaccharide deacetylase family protein [Flavitalea sp.]
MKTTESLCSRVQGIIAVSVILGVLTSITGCNFKPDVSAASSLPSSLAVKAKEADKETSTRAGSKPVNISEPADASTIITRKQVPILCYHHIKNWSATTSAKAKDYIVPVDTFKEQLKMLADSGYQTILPDDLYNYLAFNTPLPAKPVMLTFDDTDLEQFTVALPEMKKYGFKGVFFIMTVSINRPNYMSKEQVKALADEGHEIGSHTWDHRNVKLYKEEDWATQIDKPTKQLAAITGKEVKYFAYPFGLWNAQAIPELKKRGFKAAFQLSTARDPQDPLHTIRRIIVPGYWGSSSLNKCMRNSFL